jgi:hypothetical protein
LITAVFPLVFVLIAMLAASAPTQRRQEQARTQIAKVEHDWKGGLLKDPAEVTLQVGRAILDSSSVSGTEMLWLPLNMLAVFVGLPLLGYCYVYFHPLYNFLWGDYVATFEKRHSRGRFIWLAFS